MVERTEEQALVHVATVDVEGRMNVLLHQLEDADHRGVGKFSSLQFPSSTSLF
jgi:pyridoxine/pyridoxamine 5'-phosphate oxidase